MFKKLNSKLLSQYPLLWNTKLLYVIPAAIVIHVLFYLGGFFTPVELEDLYEYWIYDESGTVVFSVLISLLIIILWLVFYLRNNPFKSFYTVSRSYLFLEFLLISLVFFSTATFFLSYEQGLYHQTTITAKNVNLEEDINTLNLSKHFIAFEWREFSNENCCDSVIAYEKRDSIRRAKQSHNNNSSGYQRDVEPYYIEPRYNADDEVYNSYLFYCQNGMYQYEDRFKNDILNKYELNAIATRWLKNSQKDSVKQLFNKLVVLCEKYGIHYQFYPEKQTNECFSDSLFTVNRLVGTYPNDYEENRSTRSRVYHEQYIEISDIRTSLNRIDTVRTGFWNYEILLIWLYYSFAAAIVLFTFRLTRLKHWFIGIVGIGLWSIIVVLISILLKLDKEILPLIFIIWLSVVIVGSNLILARIKKQLAGIMYNWIFWVTPFIIPLTMAYTDIITNDSCYLYSQNYDEYWCDVNHWIDGHLLLMFSVNILVMLLVIYFVFIPLARKWQSNPEE